MNFGSITGTQICILLAILKYSIILFGPQANQYFTTEYYKFIITKKVFSYILFYFFLFLQFDLLDKIYYSNLKMEWCIFKRVYIYIFLHYFNSLIQYSTQTYVSREHSRMLLLYFTVILATLTHGWNFFSPQF